MLSIELRGTDKFIETLYELPPALRRKWNRKLDQVAEQLYQKVISNVTGKVLQTKTGQLRDSIEKEVYTDGYDFLAFIGPVPATPKAYALEYGGKGNYLIVPTAKSVLYWYDEYMGKVFTKQVDHPPSKEYAYLRRALDEISEEAPSQFLAIVNEPE